MSEREQQSQSSIVEDVPDTGRSRKTTTAEELPDTSRTAKTVSSVGEDVQTASLSKSVSEAGSDSGRRSKALSSIVEDVRSRSKGLERSDALKSATSERHHFSSEESVAMEIRSDAK